ncbi:hypothetical protein VQ056_05065 [Paenibacillus sp. JTLBN-2024]
MRKRWPAVVAGVVALCATAWFIAPATGASRTKCSFAEHLGFFNYQVAAGLKAQEEAVAVASGNIKDTVKKIESKEAMFKYPGPSASAAEMFTAKGKNVIVIQMEAFQSFPVHLSLNGQELTPVLNGLSKDGSISRGNSSRSAKAIPPMRNS